MNVNNDVNNDNKLNDVNIDNIDNSVEVEVIKLEEEPNYIP